MSRPATNNPHPHIEIPRWKLAFRPAVEPEYIVDIKKHIAELRDMLAQERWASQKTDITKAIEMYETGALPVPKCDSIWLKNGQVIDGQQLAMLDPATNVASPYVPPYHFRKFDMPATNTYLERELTLAPAIEGECIMDVEKRLAGLRDMLGQERWAFQKTNITKAIEMYESGALPLPKCRLVWLKNGEVIDGPPSQIRLEEYFWTERIAGQYATMAHQLVMLDPAINSYLHIPGRKLTFSPAIHGEYVLDVKKRLAQLRDILTQERWRFQKTNITKAIEMYESGALPLPRCGLVWVKNGEVFDEQPDTVNPGEHLWTEGIMYQL